MSGTRYIGAPLRTNRRDEPVLSGEIVPVIPEGADAMVLGTSSNADDIVRSLVPEGSTNSGGWSSEDGG